MQKLHFEQLPELVATLAEKIERLEKTIIAIKESTSVEAVNDDLLTIDEAALFVRLTKNTLYSLVSKSKIPVSKRGKRLYFRKKELEKWIAQGRRKTESELAADTEAYMLGKHTSMKNTLNCD
jgi:excisionase family DNA binding protein